MPMTDVPFEHRYLLHRAAEVLRQAESIMVGYARDAEGPLTIFDRIIVLDRMRKMINEIENLKIVLQASSLMEVGHLDVDTRQHVQQRDHDVE